VHMVGAIPEIGRRRGDEQRPLLQNELLRANALRLAQEAMRVTGPRAHASRRIAKRRHAQAQHGEELEIHEPSRKITMVVENPMEVPDLDMDIEARVWTNQERMEAAKEQRLQLQRDQLAANLEKEALAHIRFVLMGRDTSDLAAVSNIIRVELNHLCEMAEVLLPSRRYSVLVSVLQGLKDGNPLEDIIRESVAKYSKSSPGLVRKMVRLVTGRPTEEVFVEKLPTVWNQPTTSCNDVVTQMESKIPIQDNFWSGVTGCRTLFSKHLIIRPIGTEPIPAININGTLVPGTRREIPNGQIGENAQDRPRAMGLTPIVGMDDAFSVAFHGEDEPDFH